MHSQDAMLINPEIRLSFALKKWRELLYVRSIQRSSLANADIHWRCQRNARATKCKSVSTQRRRTLLLEYLRFWILRCRHDRRSRKHWLCVWKLNYINAIYWKMVCKRTLLKWKDHSTEIRGKDRDVDWIEWKGLCYSCVHVP